MIMKTFMNVFPGASLWGGLTYPGLYLIGGNRSFEQTRESLEKLTERLKKISDLSEWEDHFKNANALKRLYLLGPGDFSWAVKNFPEVTDDHPYTEFPLWRVLVKRDVPILHANIVRKYLEKLRQERTD